MSERVARGLPDSPYVSLTEAVQLLAFGEVKSEAELDREAAAARGDPESSRPDNWRASIASIESRGSKADATSLERLQHLKRKLADFDASVRAIRSASDVLFAAHVDGRLALTGFERAPRQERSPHRLTIPADYFADPREVFWAGGDIQAVLGSDLLDIALDRSRQSSRWEDVKLRRDDLLRLWRELGTGPATAQENTRGDEPVVRADTTIPAWVNLYQAVAWVRYRTADAIDHLRGHGVLGAEALFGKRPIIGTHAELQTALAEGRLVAQGARNGEPMQDIPAVEWSRMEVLPSFGRNPGPFFSIVVASAGLLNCFPALDSDTSKSPKLTPIPKKTLHDWWDSLGRDRETMRQVDLLSAVRAAFPQHTIARDRIYELTGRRTRGRRPFSDEVSGKSPGK